MSNEGKNYERRKEFKAGRRRFKVGSNADQENVRSSIKSRSRSQDATRNTKSLINLSTNDDDLESSGGQSFIARLFKYFKNPSKEASQQQTPPIETPSEVQTKKCFLGPLGLGEYVGLIDADSDDAEEINFKVPKSRSMINISVSDLWARNSDDEEADFGNGDFDGNVELISPEDDQNASRKSSDCSSSERFSLVDTFKRFIAFPPSAPNLVKFMDNHPVSKNTYKDQVTSFCGGLEDRWALPAFVVSTSSQFYPGTVCNIHRIADFAIELQVTLNWVREMQTQCQSDLKRYSQVGKQKRRIAFQNSSKAEKEAQLKELLAELSGFQTLVDVFTASQKEKSRGFEGSAIIIASCNERLSTLRSLLPASIAKVETPEYRKLKNEAVVVIRTWKNGKLIKTFTEGIAFLFSDCVVLVASSPKSSMATTSSRSNGHLRRWKSISMDNLGSYEIIARLPLTYIGLPSPQLSSRIDGRSELETASETSTRDSVTESSASTTPNRNLHVGAKGKNFHCNASTPSCSSGISSVSVSEAEQEVGLGDAVGGNDNSLTVSLWWPPFNRCQLQFANFQSWNNWRLLLQLSTEQIQSSYAGKTLRVKVQNELEEEKQCVHKYLAIGLHMTVGELKERALKAMNISRSLLDVEMTAIYSGDGPLGNSEITLSDDDRPFLLTIYATTGLRDDRQENVTEAITELFSKNFNLPIPLVFYLRNCNSRKISELRLPTIEIIDSGSGLSSTTSSPRIRRPYRRPFTTHGIELRGPKYGGVGNSVHNLRNKFSQSSHNLTDVPISSGLNDFGSRIKAHSRPLRRLGGGQRSSDYSEIEPPSLFAYQQYQGNQQTQQYHLFGRLPQDVWPDCRVPLSIMSLFVIVFYKGSSLEGIFRRSAKQSQLQQMIIAVDEDEDALSPTECPPLYAANILKKFFKDIPGHLLVDEKWNDWCKLTLLETDEEIAAYGKKMMRQLPNVNQSLLTFLLFTLAQIRVNQDTNLMSTNALAKMWAPNLIERPNADPSLDDAGLAIGIVERLLGPFTDIFCLKSVEFRQKLSICFEEIWGQITHDEEGESKSPPPLEAIKSILEFEVKPAPEEDPKSTNLGDDETAKIPELKNTKRRSRHLPMRHSLSDDSGLRQTESIVANEEVYARPASHDCGELPPPIPRRMHRHIPLLSLDEPPPLPRRKTTTGSEIKLLQMPTPCSIQKRLRQRETIPSPIDRRRSSFSHRRNSKTRSFHDNDNIERKLSTGSDTSNPSMVGNGGSSSSSTSPASSLTYPRSPISSPISPTKSFHASSLELHRSTSDVDAHVNDRYLIIKQNKNTSNFLRTNSSPCEDEINIGHTSKSCFPSSNNRFTIDTNYNFKSPMMLKRDTSWVCSHWLDVKMEKTPSPPNKIIMPHLKPGVSVSPMRDSKLPPTLLKISRPHSLYHHESCSGDDSRPKSPGSCRRGNSVYEQHRVIERTSKFFAKPEIGGEQTGVQLSRGSSLASTSSNSTLIGGFN